MIGGRFAASQPAVINASLGQFFFELANEDAILFGDGLCAKGCLARVWPFQSRGVTNSLSTRACSRNETLIMAVAARTTRHYGRSSNFRWTTQ